MSPAKLTITLPLLLATLTNGAHADSRSLDTIPLPPLAGSRLVATDIVQNGRLVSIATLEPAGTVEETLAFYRDAWPADANGPGHLESTTADWTIISHVADDVSLVVQLTDDGSGPSGLLSAMSLVSMSETQSIPPVPAGGELLSTTSAADDGTRADTAVVSSSARAGEVAGFYRDAMRRVGWKLVSDRRAGGPVTLLFDGRGARLEIVVADVDGGSVAVINEVRGDD